MTEYEGTCLMRVWHFVHDTSCLNDATAEVIAEHDMRYHV